MSVRKRALNSVEMAWGKRRSDSDFVGITDHDQIEADYVRLMKRSFRDNMGNRQRLAEKLRANRDARTNLVAEGLRYYTENLANEKVIRSKERKYGGDQSEQERRDAHAMEMEDRKYQEDVRRAKVKLNSLTGGYADQSDADDGDYQPEPEPEDSASDSENDVWSEKKRQQDKAKKQERKHREVLKLAALVAKLNKEEATEVKEITTKASSSPADVPNTPKAPGLLSRFLGAKEGEPEKNQRLQKIARIAYHRRKIKPEYVPTQEEEHALRCLDAYPEWLKAPTTPEECQAILAAFSAAPLPP